MANSDIELVFKSALGEIPQILMGKKFLQNVRAIRMVTEELLQEVIAQSGGDVELMNVLTEKEKEQSFGFECVVVSTFLFIF